MNRIQSEPNHFFLREVLSWDLTLQKVAKDNTVTLHQENQPPNVFAFDNARASPIPKAEGAEH